MKKVIKRTKAKKTPTDISQIEESVENHEYEEEEIEAVKSPSKLVVERGIISKLLETGDMNLLKDHQIKKHYFSGEANQVFKFIDDFYLTNNSLPTPRIIKNKFPKFEFESYETDSGREVIGTEETLDYWCNELRKKIIHNTLCDNMEQVFTSLDNLETNKALNIIKQTILKVETDLIETSAINMSVDGEDRKRIYEERKINKGMLGIPMGIDRLDMILKGMQPKQLITLIARTGVGNHLA